LENLYDSKDIKRAWENIKENNKTSAKDSLCLYELKQHTPWFHEECLQFLDKRKQDKIQWLQDPNQSLRGTRLQGNGENYLLGSLLIYSSPNIWVIKSRKIRRAGYVARMGEGTPEGDRPLGRPRGRLEDNVKMDLQKWDWGGMDWIALSKERDRRRALVNVVMNLRVS
jgi:hypothetical protein